MINLSDLKILELPSVLMSERRFIPRQICGCYFVIDDDNILYIGQAGNIKNRWNGHKLKLLYKQLPNVRIAWLRTHHSVLDKVEKFYITTLKPKYNISKVFSWSLINVFNFDDCCIIHGNDYNSKSFKSISCLTYSEVYRLTGLPPHHFEYLENNYMVLPLEMLSKLEQGLILRLN